MYQSRYSRVIYSWIGISRHRRNHHLELPMKVLAVGDRSYVDAVLTRSRARTSSLDPTAAGL